MAKKSAPKTTFVTVKIKSVTVTGCQAVITGIAGPINIDVNIMAVNSEMATASGIVTATGNTWSITITLEPISPDNPNNTHEITATVEDNGIGASDTWTVSAHCYNAMLSKKRLAARQALVKFE